MNKISQKVLNLASVDEKEIITGTILKNMFLKSFDVVNDNFEAINKINVYPVPDGDTGINMLETLRAIKTELLKTNTEESCGEVIRKISNGAFNGSAGNSGIIFSEYLRGLEIAWQDLVNLTSSDLKLGLNKAIEYSYKSIDQPKEGTMLSVQRKIADYANNEENFSENPYYMLINAFAIAKQALLETHFTLAEVNKAKTIDSGAFAFVFVLEGFISAVFDDEVFSVYTSRTISSEIIPFLEIDLENLIVMKQEWEVQFNTNSLKESTEKIRKQLQKEGECLIISYDSDISDYKIHIHIKKPINEFLNKIKSLFGEVENIRILDLKVQNEDFKKSLSNKR